MLKIKVETAWREFLKTLEGAPTAFSGVTAVERSRDRVIIECQGGPEEPQGSGNRLMRIAVTVSSDSNPLPIEGGGIEGDQQIVDRHAANLAAVFDAIDQAIAAGTLSASLTDQVDDFYVFNPVIALDERSGEEGSGFEETRFYTCYCCGCDIG